MSSISNEFIELKIDTVEYPMTEDKADELENLFQEVSSAVKDAKSGLEREDKVRELYGFSERQSRSEIPFPTFKSRDGEDVYTFIKDFKDSCKRRMIRKKDQFRILQGQLFGFASEAVHRGVEDVDEAIRILVKVFGDNEVIFQQKYNQFQEALQDDWPLLEEDSKNCLRKISRVQSLLRELEKMVTSSRVQKGELYNFHNVHSFFNCLPKCVQDVAIAKMVEGEVDNSEGRLLAIKESLEVYSSRARVYMLMGSRIQTLHPEKEIRPEEMINIDKNVEPNKTKQADVKNVKKYDGQCREPYV